MKKQQLSAEQKRLETDIWIIALVTLGVFLTNEFCYEQQYFSYSKIIT